MLVDRNSTAFAVLPCFYVLVDGAIFQRLESQLCDLKYSELHIFILLLRESSSVIGSQPAIRICFRILHRSLLSYLNNNDRGSYSLHSVAILKKNEHISSQPNPTPSGGASTLRHVL
jgi:hypothetical protein